MSNFFTVAEFRQAIEAEWDSIEDDATLQDITYLLAYAEKTEKLAENRPVRPRPDKGESAAYYREQIKDSNLPTASLRELIRNLLNKVEEWEQFIDDATGS